MEYQQRRINQAQQIKELEGLSDTAAESTETNNNTSIKTDLNYWLAEQVKNDSSPINMEIKKAKQRHIEELDKRAEKSKKISKVHDATLATEINSLLKDSKK